MLDACITIQMNLNYVAKSKMNSRKNAHWHEDMHALLSHHDHNKMGSLQ